MAHEYITLDDGMDFRAISREMSARGYDMNHATARNVFLAGMASLMTSISGQLGKELTEAELVGLLTNQETYNSLQEVLFASYQQLQPPQTSSSDRKKKSTKKTLS